MTARSAHWCGSMARDNGWALAVQGPLSSRRREEESKREMEKKKGGERERGNRHMGITCKVPHYYIVSLPHQLLGCSVVDLDIDDSFR